MRIFLAEEQRDVRQRELPIEAYAATKIPEALGVYLQGAPTLTGAAFKAHDLEKALNAWPVTGDDNLLEWVTDEADALGVSLLPLVLMLGRDLTLVGRGDTTVSLQ